MIYTSPYEKFKTNKYRLVSISKDKGASYIDENGKSYEGECYLYLAPPLGVDCGFAAPHG